MVFIHCSLLSDLVSLGLLWEEVVVVVGRHFGSFGEYLSICPTVGCFRERERYREVD